MSISSECASPECISPEFAAIVGLDRSDQYLDICLQATGANKVHHTRISSQPESIQEWLNGLRESFPGGHFAICLEQPAAALLHFFVHCEDVVLYPVNPLTLSRYRQAFVTSKAKSDVGDATFLLELAREHRHKLTAWNPHDANTRALALLCEGRRKAVDLRTKLSNQLTSHLKLYYPQALQVAGDDLYIPLACDFLLRWPSLQELKRARAATVRKFYIEHNCRRTDAIARRLELIKKAVAVSDDAALLRGWELTTRMLAAQLRQLATSIAEFDSEIAKVFAQHEDAPLFSCLPGAGPVFRARLLAAFGSDRSRYTCAADLEQYSGIAPVIKASGNSRLVQRRFARPLFLHQSFIEYADQSLRHCAWAKEFYRSQRDKGKGHYCAVRALAFKWIRIIFRCWKERVAYDEEKYLQALQRTGSPYGRASLVHEHGF
jgi:transposase